MSVLLQNKVLFSLTETKNPLKECVATTLGLQKHEFYLIQNGKRCTDKFSAHENVYVVLRVCGGKGGFGSMLRAIGAQIEKTTNREACRDLSGRRLRDINEEKRLKTWIAQQAEREKEVLERRKKKLEKLCEVPKYEFKDEEYDKERSALPEKVEDAVLHGLQASSSGSKRKGTEKKVVKKKKAKLWVDDELDDLSSSEDDSGEEGKCGEKPEDDEASSDSNQHKVQHEDIQMGSDKIEVSEVQNNKLESGNNVETIDSKASKKPVDEIGENTETKEQVPEKSTKQIKAGVSEGQSDKIESANNIETIDSNTSEKHVDKIGENTETKEQVPEESTKQVN